MMMCLAVPDGTAISINETAHVTVWRNGPGDRRGRGRLRRRRSL